MDKKQKIIEVLKTIYDPEIPVNIWDLGLVYGICLDKHITIKITFTSPTCPMMEEILVLIKTKCEEALKEEVIIERVWDPPWDISKMSESARIELDLMEQGF